MIEDYETYSLNEQAARAKQLRTETCGTCIHCQRPEKDMQCGDLAYCTQWGEFVETTHHPVDYDCTEYEE